MPLLAGCSDGAPCELSAGTWTLTGDYSFILGMEVTVPDGWRSLEQDAGEFTLFPLDHPNDHIFMVGLEEEDEAALERLTVEAAPIIESIRLPDSFPIW